MKFLLLALAMAAMVLLAHPGAAQEGRWERQMAAAEAAYQRRDLAAAKAPRGIATSPSGRGPMGGPRVLGG